MHNPIAVLLFSLDHKVKLLNELFARIHLYEVISPFPFEHYCVFCAKHISNEWWEPKEYFVERQQEIIQILANQQTHNEVKP